MKKKNFLSSVVLGVMILFSFCGSGFLERIGSTSPQVDYDYHMDTENYQVDVVIGEDNSYSLTETITVDMLDYRHGIYRYVPYKGYAQDADGRRVVYYADVEVTDCNVPVSTEKSGRNYVMRLGDEEETVYGLTTYKISYKWTPRFQDSSYTCAYYNIFPTYWQNEIPAGSSFSIQFPKSFEHEKLKLYYGRYGEKNDGMQIADLEWREDTLKGTLKEHLEFAGGFTLYTDMGQGYFTGEGTVQGVKWGILAAAVAVFVLIVILYFLFGRDEPILPSVQFQPPDGLDSAAVGYIIDGSVEDKDILSLILYWADRGYLTIANEKKDKIRLIKTELPLPDDVPKYEKTFFNRLFKKNDSVLISSLKYKCAETIRTSKVQVTDFIKVKGGLYTGSSVAARVISTLLSMIPMTVFVVVTLNMSWVGAGTVIINIADLALLFAGICVFNHIVDKWYARRKSVRKGLAVLGIGLSMIGIAGICGSYLMQLRSGEVFDFTAGLLAAAVSTVVCVILTGFMKKNFHVRGLMGRLVGLRDFIETAELDRLKMMAEENPDWFYHILPYTYVFGLSDVFAEKLEELAIPAPEWYSTYDAGYAHWNYYRFNRMMMSNMDTMRHTLTMVEPPKDSGSSGSSIGGGGFSGGGGGFSGGGFGGGGGGSW